MHTVDLGLQEELQTTRALAHTAGGLSGIRGVSCALVVVQDRDGSVLAANKRCKARERKQDGPCGTAQEPDGLLGEALP